MFAFAVVNIRESPLLHTTNDKRLSNLNTQEPIKNYLPYADKNVTSHNHPQNSEVLSALTLQGLERRRLKVQTTVTEFPSKKGRPRKLLCSTISLSDKLTVSNWPICVKNHLKFIIVPLQ